MRLTSIKELEDSVKINWELARKDGGFNKLTIISGDKARPEFTAAVKALKPFLIEFCEIESLDKRLIFSTGINMKYKGETDTMHVGLTGYKTLQNSPGCVNFNSAQKAEKNTTGEGTANENLLPEKCVKVINTLITEAKKYIAGDTIQREMPLKEKKEKAPGGKKKAAKKAKLKKPAKEK